MRRHPSRRWVLLAALVLWSCQPQVGDSCSNASDCSPQGERTCDTTLPGGYCTLFGCTEGSCPSEGVCIGYQSVVSIAPECANLQVRPRLQRTACMRSCERDRDCRSGYLCVDMAQPNPWGALRIDGSGSARVCSPEPPLVPVGETGVCSSQPAPAAPLVPPVPVLDAGSDSSPDAE